MFTASPLFLSETLESAFKMVGKGDNAVPVLASFTVAGYAADQCKQVEYGRIERL